MGYRIFRPAQQGIPQKKVATETPPKTGGIGIKFKNKNLKILKSFPILVLN